MARKNSHNAAFVFGAMLGGLAGAAAALWKTPYSGEELRTRITGGQPGNDHVSTPAPGSRLPKPSLGDKILSTTENLLAPVVGVTLGKTANNSGPDTPLAATSSQATAPNDAATTEPPASPHPDTERIVHEPETGGQGNVTPVDETAAVPDPSSGIDIDHTSHVASTDELTTPQRKLTPDAFKHEEHEKQPFPKLGGDEPGS